MADYKATGSLKTPRVSLDSESGEVTGEHFQNAVSQNQVEVVDGQTVRLAPALPENSVYYWPVSEGSGTTLTEKVSGADLTMSSEFWTADDTLRDGYGLQFDGDSRNATGSVPISSMSEFLLCFTIETTDTSDHSVIWWDETSSYGYVYFEYISADGTHYWKVGDGNTIVEIAPSTTLTDGNRYRVACGFVENGSTTVSVNATQEASTSFGTLGPTSDAVYFGSAPPGDRFLNGVIDSPVVYDTVSDQVIQEDYDRQPWT